MGKLREFVLKTVPRSRIEQGRAIRGHLARTLGSVRDAPIGMPQEPTFARTSSDAIRSFRRLYDGLGAGSARVLLLTDMNSRIPVILETSRARAMLVGTNGARPRLMYWPEGMQPTEGERLVTSAEAGAFPAGLPVGTVRYTASNVPEVEPLARLERLEVVRLFDYGLRGVVSPEASWPSRRACRTASTDAWRWTVSPASGPVRVCGAVSTGRRGRARPRP